MSPSLSESLSDFEAMVGAFGISSHPERYAVDGVEPLAVLAPVTEQQLSEVVASANRDGAALYPRGGGTRTDLGGVPDRPGIVVDTTNINRLVAHNPADLTATFQAGATFQLVSEVLSQQGQFLAIDPPIPGRATIGGTLAAGVGGPTRWHFSHSRDAVIGMKVVQPDGRVTKSGGQVVKNVSGYDMSRLHIGGLGSLGIVLEVSFKLTPVPMYEKTVLATFATPRAAMEAAMRVFNSHVMPLAMTGLDGPAAGRIDLDTGGLGFHLAVRLGGRPRTLDRQVNEVSGVCRDGGADQIEELGGRSGPRLWRALADFGWETEGAPELNIKVTVMPDRVGDAIAAVQLSRTPSLELATLAHPGFGTIEGSWFSGAAGPSAMRSQADSVDRDAIVDTVSRVRGKVAQLGGSAVVQRCPTEVKHVIDIWGGEPPGFEVMRRMKSVYDPNHVMNPGRFIGGM